MTETYIQKLYRTNPEFREKQKKKARQWYKDNREHKNKTYREWYANRTKSQIEKRKTNLKKLQSTHTNLCPKK